MERQMRLFCASAATALLAAACTSSSATAPQDIVVTASVAPATFRPGEQATVTISVTNLGSRPRTISTNACPDPFVVTTQAGDAVAPRSLLCSAMATSKELAPGEQFVFTPVQWSMLLPGTFLLRAQVGVHDEGVAESLPVIVRVTQ